MKIGMARIGAWLACACLTYGGAAAAQTVETFAGGRVIDNMPALEAPIVPRNVAVKPDGTIFTVNTRTIKLMRRDPATGTISLYPGAGNFYNNTGVFFLDNAGYGYVLNGISLYRLNLTTLQGTRLANLLVSGVCTVHGDIDLQFAVDSTGAVYFTDSLNNSVCKIAGVDDVRRIAGTTVAGFSGDGGLAQFAQLNGPNGIALDAANNLYISDSLNNRIRKVNATTGVITTIAGNGTWAYGGENVPAATSSIAGPTRITADAAGNLFYAERGAIRVRRLDAQTGLLRTVAGNGSFSSMAVDGGLATQSPIGAIIDLAVQANGNLLLAEDQGSSRIRVVTASTGILSTIIGNGMIYWCGESSLPRDACLNEPRGVAPDTNGDVYISDTQNARVRRYSAATGQLTTIAGTSMTSVIDGSYTGDGGPAINARFGGPIGGVALDALGNVHLATRGMLRVVKIDKSTGLISTVAGSGTYGFSGDGGPATAAATRFADYPVFDRDGNLYFSDVYNNRVRKVTIATGIITTVAGNGLTSGALGDGGAATSASLSSPGGLGFDRNGNLLIADTQHWRIRRVDKTTGVISTVAGNGTPSNTGDGGLATAAGLSSFTSFAVDPGGNITVIAANRVRRIDATTGLIQALNVPSQSPEGFQIFRADQIVFDATGNLYLGGYEVVHRITGLPFSPADSTPPVIQPTVSGPLGANGWYTGDVQVTWSVTDAESTVTTKSGCDAVTVSQDSGGTSFTCSATSGGGTNSNSVTVKRDATAPTLVFGARIPAANANGWNGSDVSIAYDASDAVSGIASTSVASPLLFSNEGIGMSQSVTVTDNAGNAATFDSPAVSIDRTPPIVNASVSGTPGNDGWYVGNVQVGWSISEIPASIESTSGCGTTEVVLDTAGTSFTCTVTSAGGTASASTTVKRDATPPALAFGAPAPAANGSGWNNTTVDVGFVASDVTSGLAGTSKASPLTFANEGVGLTQSVTATDAAGNSATFVSPALNIDKTAPVITPTLVGTSGNNGWYRGDVTVDWSVNEFPVSLVSSTGCESSTVTADTSGVGRICSATSQGGTATGSVTIKRDATPPTLSFGSFSPAPNASGWNKTNVTVPFTRADALSGVASTSATSPLTISAEGEAVTGQVTVTDNAGNSQTFSTAPRNIDKTAPVVVITAPANGATYGFYQDVEAAYSCTDVSLVSCTAPTPEGDYINTKVDGSKTFKVTAKDAVAFTTNVTNTYNVEQHFNFDGFLPNVVPPPSPNLVAKGSLVPIRWRLPDGHGGYVSNPASFTSATVQSYSCSGTVVPLNDPASGAAGISFDPATKVFTYNWQTSTSWTNCRKLVIKLKDDSLHELIFKFQ
ncbi:MAG TPA: PxKF domain-containing protein [Steroidobacteraceae bacterium]|nr:PxKF domain-containing protein [Steroidobacteraceae bacterium]